MKTFSKGLFTRFFQKKAPGGRAFYQISPDVALTTCIQLYSKGTQKAMFWTADACNLDSAPPKQGESLGKHFQKARLPVFSKKWPPGGGLSDFTRRGTNYLHTTLLKTYLKRNFLDCQSMVFGFSAPKIGGDLTRTF